MSTQAVNNRDRNVAAARPVYINDTPNGRLVLAVIAVATYLFSHSNGFVQHYRKNLNIQSVEAENHYDLLQNVEALFYSFSVTLAIVLMNRFYHEVMRQHRD